MRHAKKATPEAVWPQAQKVVLDFFNVYQAVSAPMKKHIAPAKPEPKKTPPRDQVAVGARIRWLREIQGKTQSEVALDLSLPQQVMSRMETGDRKLSFRDAKKLCDYWGVTTDYLYRGVLYPKIDHELAARLAALHPELMLDEDWKSPARKKTDKATS